MGCRIFRFSGNVALQSSELRFHSDLVSMLPDYPRPAPTASSSPLARHCGLLVLRLTAGGSLLFWYGGREAMGAWSHVWQKTPWALPGQLTALGFPAGLTLALLLVSLVLLGSLFIILGLLTRLSAITLGLVSLTTAFLYTAFPEIEEQALLYTGICLAICLSGPGLFALDRVLRATAGRRK